MKRFIPFLLIAILISGCGKRDTSTYNPNPNSKFDQDITYNNITSDESIEQVKSLLSGKISGLSLELFLDDLNEYNTTVGNLQGPYTKVDSTSIEYDLEDIRNNWTAKYPEYIGNNCRITTYELIKDLMKLNSKDIKGENLIFDNESLNQSNKFDKYEINEFNTYYKDIPTEDTADINVHVEKIKEYYNKINLQFNLPENFSVISVFFHDDTNKDNVNLFIGHTGLLIHDNDKYIFIEKLSFELPYQIIEFNNKQELNDYLMNMYDVSWGQKNSKPFIMENGELLKEYRTKTK